MSIRFKFRSSINFESLDIEGRASISLRELRLMIARQKKLHLGRDFDLIFFNADSGQEYNDENLQIVSRSSVIVKRVPTGMVSSTVKPPIGTMKNLGLKDVDHINHVDGQVIDFHDFGPDIFPVAEGIFLDINVGFGHKNCSDFAFQYQKFDSIGLNQAIQRGSNHCKIPTKLPKSKTPDAPTLPVELNCSLCSTFFKNAVMIPCCQYSFCEKCIRLALLEKAMCPKCSSSRCRVEDLLPNISLRRAIEHFLESQMVFTQSENALRRYVPDAESCNQVKDISCVVTVVQREPEMPHSPSASGKGSNQVMAEPFYDSIKKEKSLSRTMQQIHGGRGRYANHWNFPSVPDGPEDCRGENKPLNLLPSAVQHEVDYSNKKNTGTWCDTRGGRVKKDRSCYLCGSPYHLISECAFASNPNPMLQTGGFSAYSSPFWINNRYSTPRPFANSTLWPFANMNGHAPTPMPPPYVPQTPMPPNYMRSIHAGRPLRGGQYFQVESNFTEHCSKNDREATGMFHQERKRGVNCHERGSQPKDHPRSALEPSSPVHPKARSKERRGFRHDAKNSRHHARHSTEVRDSKKWMSSGSSEDRRDGHYRKRKRDH